MIAIEKKQILTVLATILSLIFVSCAFDVAHVEYAPASLTACSENCPSFVVQKELTLDDMPCSYKRKLKENSEWKMVGSIVEGDVYKPLNQCLTIECSNVFEAYLVVDGNNLKGFYLPVEDGFVALEKTVEMAIK